MSSTLTVGDRRILTGDNFEVPRVGMKGTVARIDFHGYILIRWDDGFEGWFTLYQANKWTARCING